MSPEDIIFTVNLICMAFVVDDWLFRTPRTVKRMVDKCKKDGRCIICERPITIVSEKTSD